MFQWQALLVPITASLITQVVIKVISLVALRQHHDLMLEEERKQTAYLHLISQGLSEPKPVYPTQPEG